jgi:hypothetical protein
MAEATGISAKQLSNVGDYMLFELKAETSTTETITIPSNVPVTTSSIVVPIAVRNVSDGTIGVAAYSKANKQFTYTESGASDDDVRILFYIAN